jgi:hypothetical protein
LALAGAAAVDGERDRQNVGLACNELLLVGGRPGRTHAANPLGFEEHTHLLISRGRVNFALASLAAMALLAANAWM